MFGRLPQVPDRKDSCFFPRFLLVMVILASAGRANADPGADFQRLSKEYWAQLNASRYAEAEQTALRLRQLAEGPLAAQPARLGIALNYLGTIYHYQGRYAQAEPLYRQALAIREKVLGPEHPSVGDSLDSLATLYQDQGKYSQAEPLFQRVVAIWEKAFGPEHLDVAGSLNNLASLYRLQGKYTEAEPLYQRALRIRQKALGPSHPDVAASLNNLANLYYNQGKYAQAEPLHQRALEIRRQTLGPEHRAVAQSLDNLASLYDNQGKYAQAEPLYRQALAIREKTFGPEHRAVAQSLDNLASVNLRQSKYAQAEPLYQRALAIREKVLGADHPDVAASLNNLATLYVDQRNYAQAEQLYRRAAAIWEKNLGPEHPLVATSLDNLAIVFWLEDKLRLAEPLYQRTLAIREKSLGPGHPDVARTLNNLANLHESRGEYAQAEQLYQRALNIRERALGPDHPDVARFGLYNLARLHAETQRWTEATAETDRSRQIVRRHMARELPGLSEKEQLAFLQMKDQVQWHHALSLGLHRRDDVQTVQRSASWVLNGKAVAQESLSQRAILAIEASDPAVADLVQQLLAVRSRLATLSMSTPKSGQEADYRRQLAAIDQQERELSRKVGSATGRGSSADAWVELDAVRKALDKKTVLVEVVRFRVWGPDRLPTAENPSPSGSLPKGEGTAASQRWKWLPARYAAWLIPAAGAGEVSIVDLGEAQAIEDAVAQARKVLEKAEKSVAEKSEAEAEKRLRDAMRNVAHRVFEPVKSHLGDARQLIVSPDAALWLVPWGALPLTDGKYAVETYEISYCVSGRDLVTQATSKKRSTTDPILFANPDYDLAPGQVEASTRAVLRSAAPVEQVSSRGLGSLSTLPRVARLPGTAEEAAAIKPNVARYAGAEPMIYEDQYALEGVFKAVHRPKVLVLSTHGFFMPDQEVAHKDDRAAGPDDKGPRNQAALTTEGKPLENPLLRCGLMLTGCNRRGDGGTATVDDGILTGLEIVGTDLRGTDLVVLSACETGLGDVRNGEGVAGLRQAFQLAGAKAVLSTLWQIPDQETVDLMNGFFANLSSGQSKAQALREAQLAQIKARRESNSAAHPYYWAAFTLTGR